MTALDTCEAQPAAAIERRREQDRALTIAVLGRKGGSGKSTTAFNLAGSFVHRGLRCLLIDFDSQASISALFFADVKRNVIQPGQGTRNQMTTQSIGARLVDVTSASRILSAGSVRASTSSPATARASRCPTRSRTTRLVHIACAACCRDEPRSTTW